jgi:hypothetical protein
VRVEISLFGNRLKMTGKLDQLFCMSLKTSVSLSSDICGSSGDTQEITGTKKKPGY